MPYLSMLMCYSVREILHATFTFIFLFTCLLHIRIPIGRMRTLVFWMDLALNDFYSGVVLVFPKLFPANFQPSQNFRLMPLRPDHRHIQNVKSLLLSTNHLYIIVQQRVLVP